MTRHGQQFKTKAVARLLRPEYPSQPGTGTTAQPAAEHAYRHRTGPGLVLGHDLPAQPDWRSLLPPVPDPGPVQPQDHRLGSPRQRRRRARRTAGATHPAGRGHRGRSGRVFIEWHRHQGTVRFYGKFFRHRYPGALMWLVTFRVWPHLSRARVYLTARRLLAKLGLFRG